MARKKGTLEAQEAAVATALPVEGEVSAEQPVAPVTAEVNGHQQNGNGNGRKPLASFRLGSDRTTSIEVSVWANTYTSREGEEYEQLSLTFSRSYKDQNGQWVKGGSWRCHDIPCLNHLIAKAYAFCLDRRVVDSTIPF